MNQAVLLIIVISGVSCVLETPSIDNGFAEREDTFSCKLCKASSDYIYNMKKCLVDDETLFWALKVVCKVADKSEDCEQFVDQYVRKILQFQKNGVLLEKVCIEELKLC